MIRFKAKTEEQVSRILPIGTYTFKLLELKPVKSKDGTKDMAYIKLEAKGCGKTVEIEDRIPFVEKMEFKWRHFCYSCGLHQMYESEIFTGIPKGEFWGNAKVGIEEDPSGTYPPKNKIIDYIPRENVSATETIKTANTADLDDDIPF